MADVIQNKLFEQKLTLKKRVSDDSPSSDEAYKYAVCLVNIKAMGVRTFSYEIPLHFQNKIKIGQALLVPFGRQGMINAFCVGFSNYLPPEIKAKPITKILEETPLFSADYLKLLEWVANYYCTDLITVLNAAIPLKLIEKSLKTELSVEYVRDFGATKRQLQILELLKEKGKTNEDNKNNIQETLCDKLDKTVFSLPDIQNNLTCLDLKISNHDRNDSISLEGINNLKSLKKLTISNYDLKIPFTLKLFNLVQLQLFEVENISFDENMAYNIVKLLINESSIKKPNELINFPNLEDLRILKCSFQENINFKNLKKLKTIYTESNILSKIKDEDISSLTTLDEILIFNAFHGNKEMVKKLLLFPNIEKLSIISGRFESDDLKDIKGKNLSLKKLEMKYIQRECDLNDFQIIFPNVNKITINSIETPMEVHPWCGTCQMEQRGKNYKTRIIIEENKECNTDKICIIGGGCSMISLLCNSFENLKELYIDIENMIKCCTVPIFDEENKLIFKSLETFSFCISRRSKDVLSGDTLKIISNNVDKMPNLKTFRLSCCLTKFEEKIYLELIKKILLLNLDEIYLLIRIGTFTRSDYYFGFTNGENRYDYNSYERYSKKELLDMCQDKKIIIKNYHKIAIYKLKLSSSLNDY